MKEVNIVELMEAYSKGPSEEAKQKLVKAVAVYVFLNLKCILGKSWPADEDARSEFIVWLYPQLERIVERFDPTKASFPTYVSAGVKYRYIRFCAESARLEEIRRAAESEEMKLSDGYSIESADAQPLACDAAPPYGTGVLPCVQVMAGKSEASKRRIARDILLLALKSTFYLSEDLIDKVSAFCGMPREELDGLIETVRRDYGARQGAYEELRLRKYRYYIRAFSCRKKLSEIMPAIGSFDSKRLSCVEKERDFCDRQGARLNSRMEKLQRNPSNRYLAELLGLPRGSVNSALARMKKRLYSLEDGNSAGDI